MTPCPLCQRHLLEVVFVRAWWEESEGWWEERRAETSKGVFEGEREKWPVRLSLMS
jgi:hypothetical protein